MSVGTAKNSTPWTLALPEGETDPVGPVECLNRAIKRLGPFKHKLQDDADRLGPWIGMNGRIAISEQLAFEQVWILSTSFNRQELASRGAPRTKNVILNLQTLERLSADLARHLKSLDDITRHRLQTAGTGLIGTAEIIEYPLMEAADAAGLPVPHEARCYPASDTWVKRLEALSLYTGSCLDMFLASKGIDSVDSADKGGNTNLYRALYGSPRWSLVTSGWHTYELFKPGEASGTEGGPFHLFLLDVFEYATGLDPEEDSKLTYWLKRVPKVHRRYGEILRRQAELNREVHRLWRIAPGIGNDERTKQSESICAEIRALEGERMKLWPELYPHNYPQKDDR